MRFAFASSRVLKEAGKRTFVFSRSFYRSGRHIAQADMHSTPAADAVLSRVVLIIWQGVAASGCAYHLAGLDTVLCGVIWAGVLV